MPHDVLYPGIQNENRHFMNNNGTLHGDDLQFEIDKQI